MVPLSLFYFCVLFCLDKRPPGEGKLQIYRMQQRLECVGGEQLDAVQRPETDHQPAKQLAFVHNAKNPESGINRTAAVVAHHKVAAVGDGDGIVQFARGISCEQSPGLGKTFAVDAHRSVIQHFDAVARTADHPLDENSLAAAECNQIADFRIRVRRGKNEVSFMQSGGHGVAVDHKSGEQQHDRGRQNGDQQKQNQKKAQKTSAAALAGDALKFRTQLLGSRAVAARRHLGRIRIHRRPPCQGIPA